MPTIMPSNKMPNRTELLQGTLDMLILRTLLYGPAHGHQIAKHIQRKGWIAAKWELAKDRNREFKYYRLTPAGKKQLVREESRWKQLAAAVATVMRPAPGD